MFTSAPLHKAVSEPQIRSDYQSWGSKPPFLTTLGPKDFVFGRVIQFSHHVATMIAMCLTLRPARWKNEKTGGNLDS